MIDSRDPFEPPALTDLRDGQAEAWRRAFDLLWRVVQRAAARYLTDRGAVEETAAQALQETRVAAKTAGSWAEVGALAVVIARRRAISRRRAQAADKRPPEIVAPLDPELVGEDREPPQYAALRALDVRELLATLEPTQRELLEDYFLVGLTSEEVATKRGVPAATVRSQVMRMLAHLRERVQTRRNDPARKCDITSGDLR
ncbi:MAG: sigma-70 family RNA polymerase sigma factor [Verrucomicrobia bacterium]|nr:sigma-70 family RNA polymerase sigma factor [Verrucomicrobiota bacterium]